MIFLVHIYYITDIFALQFNSGFNKDFIEIFEMNITRAILMEDA